MKAAVLILSLVSMVSIAHADGRYFMTETRPNTRENRRDGATGVFRDTIESVENSTIVPLRFVKTRSTRVGGSGKVLVIDYEWAIQCSKGRGTPLQAVYYSANGFVKKETNEEPEVLDSIKGSPLYYAVCSD